MPFPPSDREVYEINPLNEVISQIRYPAILRVSAETPSAFQESIRGRYPIYEEKMPALPPGLPPQFSEGLSDLLAGLPFPTPLGARTHEFANETESQTISLTQNFIAVTDRQYSCWEHFREAVELAEDAFNRIYAPNFYQRVGLRYVDLLVRELVGMPDVPWSKLLNPTFIGMLGDRDLTGELQEFTTEALLKIPDVENGFLRLRHGLAIGQPSNEQVYLIDADFYTERRSDHHDALQHLDTFNKWGGCLFRWATTTKLRDALGRQPL